MSERDLKALFAGELAAVDDPAARAEWRPYLGYHARRYATLTAAAAELLAGVSAPRVLDVGPMFEVGLLRGAGATVDTLGFPRPPPGLPAPPLPAARRRAPRRARPERAGPRWRRLVRPSGDGRGDRAPA